MSIVVARKLSKEYDSFRAVDQVDFDIRPAECFGFLGPNGAGKTTVMRMVSCFFPPTAGSLEAFGLDATREAARIKSRIGVMPQDNNLDPDLSVFENLLVYARYFDIPRRDGRRIAADLLDFVELTDKEEVKIDQLSGGMKRRLLLARSLVNKPELLVLDEPTTGLDPHSRRAVWEILNSLKRNNTTLILTTHYMEEAEKLCDRVAIMDSGRIVTIDRPKSLMDRHGGNLEDVYLTLTGRNLEA